MPEYSQHRVGFLVLTHFSLWSMRRERHVSMEMKMLRHCTWSTYIFFYGTLIRVWLWRKLKEYSRNSIIIRGKSFSIRSRATPEPSRKTCHASKISLGIAKLGASTSSYRPRFRNRSVFSRWLYKDEDDEGCHWKAGDRCWLTSSSNNIYVGRSSNSTPFYNERKRVIHNWLYPYIQAWNTTISDSTAGTWKSTTFTPSITNSMAGQTASLTSLNQCSSILERLFGHD